MLKLYNLINQIRRKLVKLSRKQCVGSLWKILIVAAFVLSKFSVSTKGRREEAFLLSKRTNLL